MPLIPSNPVLAAVLYRACRPHLDESHTSHVDDATVLLDAAKDAAAFGGTPPPLGADSTEVLKEADQPTAQAPAGAAV